MPQRPSDPPARDQLSLKVGGWIEAHATGYGVVAVSVLVVVLAAAGLAQVWLLA